MTLPFVKFDGAGNDFVFVDAADLDPSGPSRGDLAKWLCRRKTSIGADGLVIIEDFQLTPSEARFRWDFYNNDGSSAEMCGNAARCATAYSFLRSGIPHCQFETQMGSLLGYFQNGAASVRLPLEQPSISSVDLTVGEASFRGFFVNSGVPHFVLPQTSFAKLEPSLALQIQTHPHFGSANTNVTLLEAHGEPRRTVSFERGVKGYTLACGTGAIACALVLQHTDRLAKVDLQAPGGLLGVEILDDKVLLTGPAQRIYEGSAFLG